jgi:hypothetical protein
LALRGPPAVVAFRKAAEEVVRLDVGALVVADNGDFGRAALPLVPALRNGDGVRPTTGGVDVRDGGGVGRLIAGLSQEEKKSLSDSPAGVEAPSEEGSATTSVMTTSSGYLCPFG